MADPERYALLEQVKFDLGIYADDPAADAELTIALDAASEELERLTGEHIAPVSARVNLATRRLTARWWQRKDSPQGVMGGFSDVPLYVRGSDPDIEWLINSLQHSWGLG